MKSHFSHRNQRKYWEYSNFLKNWFFLIKIGKRITFHDDRNRQTVDKRKYFLRSRKRIGIRKLEKRNGRGVTMSSSSLWRGDRKIRDKKIFSSNFVS